MPIDCRVIRHIYEGTLSEAVCSKLSAEYVEAARQAGSIRERDSVTGQLDTLIDYLGRSKGTYAERKAQDSRIVSLEAIKSALEMEIEKQR